MLPWLLISISPIIYKMYENIYIRNYSLKRNVSEKSHDLGLIFIFLILFGFGALRSVSVGGDNERYVIYFNYAYLPLLEYITTFRHEIGYLLLNKLFYMIFKSYRSILVFTSLIYSYSLLRFIRRNSKSPPMSLYLAITSYFLGASFNNIRQSIAISFLLIGFEFIKERKFIKFIFFVLVSASFHRSSIIFIILYFLYDKKISMRYFLLVISTGVVIFFIVRHTNIIVYIIRLFNNDSSIVLEKSNKGLNYFFFLCLLILLFFSLMNFSQRNDPNLVIFLHMLIIGALIQILAPFYNSFFRVVRLFSISMIILTPNIISRFSWHFRIIIYIVLVVISFLFFYKSLLSDSLGVVPYIFMFED
jgi:hypothetical protein